MAGPTSSNDNLDSPPLSEINVTPFVDVVLVLLVIFMVTAPTMMRDSIGIKLPKAGSSDTNQSVHSIGIAVNAQGQIILNGATVTLMELANTIINELKAFPNSQALISADNDTKHGDVVRVIDSVKKAGLSKFAIQIQKESGP